MFVVLLVNWCITLVFGGEGANLWSNQFGFIPFVYTICTMHFMTSSQFYAIVVLLCVVIFPDVYHSGYLCNNSLCSVFDFSARCDGNRDRIRCGHRFGQATAQQDQHVAGLDRFEQLNGFVVAQALQGLPVDGENLVSWGDVKWERFLKSQCEIDFVLLIANHYLL